MRVEDVAEDTCGGRCCSCNRKIKKRHHELVLIDEESGQEVGRYHAAPAFGCLSAAEKYTTTPGPPMVCSWIHPERCSDGLSDCDGGANDVKKEKKK